ncbi:MAG: DNA-processing protein DprA [Pseudomonadota bacterium]
MTHAFIPNPSLRGTDPIAALRLIRSEQVGPMTFFRLVKFCGSVEKALEMAPDISRRGGRKKPILIATRASAEREYDALTKFGARIIMYGEEAYPRLLQYIADAPPILTVRGHTHLFAHTKTFGMVGARNASTNGCLFAKKIAADIGAAGYSIVSGLARGIDAAVHRGSLATGTIAVIGGGIDNIYPPENAALFDEIAASGAILSELPFGAEPHARSFPGRNRIIAGMSRGVLVVEASLKSGSLITADFAQDYGRDVFAIPGSPMDPRCHGTNRLLKDGATMVETVGDILSNLSPIGELPLAEESPRLFAEPQPSFPDEKTLDDARAKILEALSASPTLLDDVLAATDLTPHVLMAVLLELELAGRLERHAGSKVALRMGEVV